MSKNLSTLLRNGNNTNPLAVSLGGTGASGNGTNAQGGGGAGGYGNSGGWGATGYCLIAWVE